VEAAHQRDLPDVTPGDHKQDRYRNGQHGHLRRQVIGETALVGLCSHDDLRRDVIDNASAIRRRSALTYVKSIFATAVPLSDLSVFFEEIAKKEARAFSSGPLLIRLLLLTGTASAAVRLHRHISRRLNQDCISSQRRVLPGICVDDAAPTTAQGGAEQDNRKQPYHWIGLPSPVDSHIMSIILLPRRTSDILSPTTMAFRFRLHFPRQ
jgi:hypothetical protein